MYPPWNFPSCYLVLNEIFPHMHYSRIYKVIKIIQVVFSSSKHFHTTKKLQITYRILHTDVNPYVK